MTAQRAATTTIQLRCQQCAQITEKPLNWLLYRIVDGEHAASTLAAHETACGHAIDLTTKENRAAIGKRATIL